MASACRWALRPSTRARLGAQGAGRRGSSAGGGVSAGDESRVPAAGGGERARGGGAEGRGGGAARVGGGERCRSVAIHFARNREHSRARSLHASHVAASDGRNRSPRDQPLHR